MFKNAIATAALLTLSVAGTAMAATSTSSFEARIIITKTCDVTTTAPTHLDFGTVAAGATNVDTTSTITVRCSKGTPYSIALSPTGSSTTGAGTMAALNVAPTAGNTDAVPYQLYSNAARSQVWGSQGGTGGNVKSGTGQGLGVTSDTHTVYGRVPGTDYTPDSYKDTVTVTLTY